MSKADQPESSAWIVEPAPPGQLHFQISVGEGTEVTPEQIAAIKEMVDGLLGAEVEGYLPSNPGCAVLITDKKKQSVACGPQLCFHLYACAIA